MINIFAKIVDWFFWKNIEALTMKYDLFLVGRVLSEKETGKVIYIIEREVATPEVLQRIQLIIYNNERIKNAQSRVFKSRKSRL